MSISNNSRILITGANGFLGHHTVEAFSSHCEAFALDDVQLLTPRSAELNLLESNAIHYYLQHAQPDIVIHLAAQCGGIGVNRVVFFCDNIHSHPRETAPSRLILPRTEFVL